MNARSGVNALLAVLLQASSVVGQTAGEPAAAPETAKSMGEQPQTVLPAPAHSAWSVGPIDFSGLIDAYYDVNFNHPANGVNQIRNFDTKANQVSLNMAKLSLAHTPSPVGFQFDIGYGDAFDVLHAIETAPRVFHYIEQAYISVKPAQFKGVQIDVGKFLTAAGAELTETHLSWNYSRSLLFSWACPYYHFGVRTTIPVGKYFTGGIQLVNGWNNVDDNNTGKTLGLSGSFATSKVTWTNVYYTGPEKADTNKGFRNLYDTTLLLTPNERINAYINFDYGRDNYIDSGHARWFGIAVATRFAITPKWSFTTRLERFDDSDGFSTGVSQKLWECTLTGEYKMTDGLLTRLEYRHDQSNRAFFNRGPELASAKSLNTVLLGVVAYFGPKR